MIDTLLFDLDGTLVPYWQDAYLSTYLKSVAAVFAREGYDPKAAVQALLDGCYAMIGNDGSRTNREVFFETFLAQLGEEAASLESALDQYYRTDFSVVKTACPEERDCRPMIRRLREKGYRLVLATNPLFPISAIAARLSWVGLAPEDFDHITLYDNSRYAKPNNAYYTDLIEMLGVSPDRCMMIGNNIAEDMIAGGLGLKTYLVHGYIENPENEDPAAYPGGSYDDLSAMLAALPKLS